MSYAEKLENYRGCKCIACLRLKGLTPPVGRDREAAIWWAEKCYGSAEANGIADAIRENRKTHKRPRKKNSE